MQALPFHVTYSKEEEKGIGTSDNSFLGGKGVGENLQKRAEEGKANVRKGGMNESIDFWKSEAHKKIHPSIHQLIATTNRRVCCLTYGVHGAVDQITGIITDGLAVRGNIKSICFVRHGGKLN